MLELLSGNGLVAGLIAVVLALLGALGVSIRSNGKRSAEAGALRRQAERDAQQAEAIRQAVEERANVDESVNRLPDGGAAGELLKRYSRD